jgi:hypothetical protein
MTDEEKPKFGWGGRRENLGRKPGQVDPRPKEIRELLLQAASESNYGTDDGKEPPSALRFFVALANNNLDIFSQLLLKTIPKQVNAQTASTIGIEIYRSELDIRRDMEQAGFSTKQIDMIQNILPGPTPINGKEQLLDEEVSDDDVEMPDRNRDHDD